MAAPGVEVGSKWGRWAVVKRASPAQRYGESYVRARVLVRCVCSHERIVFESDLRAGKTTGCRAAACLARWRVAVALRDHVDQMIAGFLTDSGPSTSGRNREDDTG